MWTLYTKYFQLQSTMAYAKSPSKKLSEKWRYNKEDDVTLQECQICRRHLVVPRTLPCLHTFCEGCILVLLQGYEHREKLDRTFKCPTCRVRVPCHILGAVSADWLRMFPEARVINKMKKAVRIVEEICRWVQCMCARLLLSLQLELKGCCLK